MKEYIKAYFKILFESKSKEIKSLSDIPYSITVSNNNFPEDTEINITSELSEFPKDITVILPKHCIASLKSEIPHGFNYVNLTKKQELCCVKHAINQLLEKFSLKELFKIRRQRFYIKWIHKSTSNLYKLAFETIGQKNKLLIRLVTFLKTEKFNDGTISKGEYIEQLRLNDIIFEKRFNQYYLGELYF